MYKKRVSKWKVSVQKEWTTRVSKWKVNIIKRGFLNGNSHCYKKRVFKNKMYLKPQNNKKNPKTIDKIPKF